MSGILVDTNVLLDVVTRDPVWAEWSVQQLDAAAIAGPIGINDTIYAELSVRFDTIEAVDAVLQNVQLKMLAMPRAALFLAGKAFGRYRAAGGIRGNILPDFFVGAHAAVNGLTLLTRDARRYQTYFPTVTLISP